MALFICRYKYDKSYIISETSERVKVEFEKVSPFYIEDIRQSGGMENIILEFFNRDDDYGNLLDIKTGIMELLGTKAEDFDFLSRINQSGFEKEYFYKPYFITTVLQKIEDNKERLLNEYYFPWPESIKGISNGLAFSKKALEDGDLLTFRFE